MIWENLYSWSNQKIVTLDSNKPEVIEENVIIKKSTFKDILKNSTLWVTNKNFYISIDYCTFIGCSSKDSGQERGVIYFGLTEYGSVSITRTIADSCSSSFGGNFAHTEIGYYGSVFVLMTSIDKCAPDFSGENYHSILMYYGTQILKNINNTRCCATRHPAFTNYDSKTTQIDFCNIVDNTATQSSIHCFAGHGEARRVNYIRNHQKSIFPKIPGVVGNYARQVTYKSLIVLSDCVFEGNTGSSLISVDNADITLVGCSLDRTDFSETDGRVYNAEPRIRPPVTMTLMGGSGKHADIPYREGSDKINMLLSRSILAIAAMMNLSEGINFRWYFFTIIVKLIIIYYAMYRKKDYFFFSYSINTISNAVF